MHNPNALPNVTDDFSPAAAHAGVRRGDGALVDRWGRRITYIRLSVTDRCDFRCRYCMPLKVQFLPKRMVLSLEEYLRVARVFSQLGVNKVRITGGEPLVRSNIVWLCEKIAALPKIQETVITTNGSQLRKLARSLCAAGVRRLNISLDTLDAGRFQRLTHSGKLSVVLDGIDAALAAGFPGGVKINTVMMRGTNDDELTALAQFALQRGMDISYIEEMPLGEVGHRRGDTYYSAVEALAQLRQTFDLRASDFDSGGPARYWQVAGSGKIGFITPHSHNFCALCNRVRISAGGQLYPCLGQNDMVELREVIRQDSDEALRRQIMQAMDIKPRGHDFDVYADGVKVVRFMSATGG